MAATVFVPTPLRKLTKGQPKIELDGTDIAGIIDRAEVEFPGFRARVLEPGGEIKRFVNVFVNGVDVRTLKGKATELRDGDQVHIIPAMAGGAGTPAHV